MTSDQFREHIAALGLSAAQMATVLQVQPVNVRRWLCGMHAVPAPVVAFLHFARAVDPEERAAILWTMLARENPRDTAKARAKPREACDAA